MCVYERGHVCIFLYLAYFVLLCSIVCSCAIEYHFHYYRVFCWMNMPQVVNFTTNGHLDSF